MLLAFPRDGQTVPASVTFSMEFQGTFDGVFNHSSIKAGPGAASITGLTPSGSFPVSYYVVFPFPRFTIQAPDELNRLDLRRNPHRLWKDALVQAKVYGLCLDLLRFDYTGPLDIVIVPLSREKKPKQDELALVLREALHALPTDRVEFQKRFKAWIYDFDYNREDAARDIDWARGNSHPNSACRNQKVD